MTNFLIALKNLKLDFYVLQTFNCLVILLYTFMLFSSQVNSASDIDGTAVATEDVGQSDGQSTQLLPASTVQMFRTAVSFLSTDQDPPWARIAQSA
jgi:hypothetical protein